VSPPWVLAPRPEALRLVVSIAAPVPSNRQQAVSRTFARFDT
jgi:hypothetical protein